VAAEMELGRFVMAGSKEKTRTVCVAWSKLDMKGSLICERYNCNGLQFLGNIVSILVIYVRTWGFEVLL
jgi:hypothetical protein